MKIHLFILILSLILNVACTKKIGTIPANPAPAKHHDTLFPGSYFPVFPNSKWIYLAQNNQQITLKTDSVYKLDYYVEPSFVSDTFYVPFYDNVGVWGYKLHNGGIHPGYPYDPFVAIVSETTALGSSWPVLQNGADEICRKVIACDTSVLVGSVTYSPVIVTEDYYCQGPSFYVWTTRRFFAKNIGIIREDSYDYNSSTITTVKSLVSYTVGH